LAYTNLVVKGKLRIMIEAVEVAAGSPRYFQVKLALQKLIADLDEGSSLPAERALAEQLGTSRTTLRKALAELSGEGVLRRTQGSGNFVAPPKIVHVRQLTSMTEDLDAEEMRVTSRVLEFHRQRASREIAARLEIPTGARILRLVRLRCVDDEPLAIEEAHLPGRFPGMEGKLAQRGSLYATLRECYDTVIASVEDTVETGIATPAEADLLTIAAGQPMLLIHRTARDAGARVVEWTRSIYRGDRFRFVARG
jgi:GntR family transcriptional regulator, nutrient-sensing system regulator